MAGKIFSWLEATPPNDAGATDYSRRKLLSPAPACAISLRRNMNGVYWRIIKES